MARLRHDPYTPCPCGSGKKYKFCCAQRHRADDRTARPGPSCPLPIADRGAMLVGDLGVAEELAMLGHALVTAGEPEKALPLLNRAIAEAPFVAMPYNNMACAHFLLGDLEQAWEVQSLVLREVEPDNVYALGALVHYGMLLGRTAAVELAASKLAELSPIEETAAVKQAEAFARLGRHAAVRDAAEGHRDLAHSCGRTLDWYAGVARLNLGDGAGALPWLKRAAHASPRDAWTARCIDRCRRGVGPGTFDGTWPYFLPQDWLPQDVLQGWLDDRARQRQTGDHLRLPGLSEFHAAILRGLDDPVKDEDMVLDTLRLLGLGDSPHAREVLRAVAFGRWGTDRARMVALQRLCEIGDRKASEPARVFLNGDWQEVRMLATEVTTAAVRPLPEDLHPRAEAAQAALHRGDWLTGEMLNREIIAAVPGDPRAYHNLAVALAGRGRDREAEEQLRQAMRIDPAYLFAPATLSQLLCRDGRVAEARALLGTVMLPARVHPSALATFHLARATVARAEGDEAGYRLAVDLAVRIEPGIADSIAPLDGGTRGGLGRLPRRSLGFLPAHAEVDPGGR